MCTLFIHDVKINCKDFMTHPHVLSDCAADKITSPGDNMKEGKLSFHISLLLITYITLTHVIILMS